MVDIEVTSITMAEQTVLAVEDAPGKLELLKADRNVYSIDAVRPQPLGIRMQC